MLIKRHKLLTDCVSNRIAFDEGQQKNWNMSKLFVRHSTLMRLLSLDGDKKIIFRPINTLAFFQMTSIFYWSSFLSFPQTHTQARANTRTFFQFHFFFSIYWATFFIIRLNYFALKFSCSQNCLNNVNIVFVLWTNILWRRSGDKHFFLRNAIAFFLMEKNTCFFCDLVIILANAFIGTFQSFSLSCLVQNWSQTT